MKILIVGGHFGAVPKKSGVIDKIAKRLNVTDDVTVTNGGFISDLATISATGFQLILWFPDVDNTILKFYPLKDQGAVLICSKVLRGTNQDFNRTQAVTRIFKMHGNAVVLISKKENQFKFELIDALNNTWDKPTTDIKKLCGTILNLAYWTFASKRHSLRKDQSLQQLVNLNRQVADRFQADMGRYFGNCSTRCMSMFPSTRYYFSRRNIDKNRLTVEDMVMVTDCSYYGKNKPSVDTPVQMQLYRECSKINFFIHGHAHIPDQPTTFEYFPCGDLREVQGIVKLIENNKYGIINLKNHGFLIYAETIEQLKAMVTLIKFAKEPNE